MNAAYDDAGRSRRVLRRRLLWLLAIGFLGTAAELWLLDHTEGFWQKVPLGIILFSLLALWAQGFGPGRWCHRLFQAAMFLAMAGGVAGLVLHFRGNMEFELEMYPEASGWSLVWKTLKGATPALAPGMMILLGLLGLAIPRGRPASCVPSATTKTEKS